MPTPAPGLTGPAATHQWFVLDPPAEHLHTLIPKPFSREQLSGTITGMLADRPADP